MPRPVQIQTGEQYQGLQLGQLTPADSNAASIYSPAAGIVTEITSIVVTNTDGSAHTYRIFHDEDGSTYSTATALYYDVGIAANTTVVLEPLAFMANEAGNLAVRSNSANNLTFTAYGKETQTGAR